MATLLHDVVKASRNKMIGNERQAIATLFTYLTGHLSSKKQLMDAMLTGSSSSGKTHCQRVALEMLPQENDVIYRTSAGSPKAFIYDEELVNAKYIAFSELKKLSDEWIEFLKSLSGDDDNFVFRVTGEGRGKVREVHRLELEKKPYTLTSADELTDVELRNRLLMIPTDESVELNRAVNMFQLGVTEIDYDGAHYSLTDDDDNGELFKKTRKSIKMLDDAAPDGFKVDIPVGFVPPLLQLIDSRKVSSRRHSKIIGSMIRSSAMLDFEDRRKLLFGGGVVAGAQDLLNVFILQPILQTTVTEIDDRARMILDFVSQNSQCTRLEILEHIKLSTLSDLSTKQIGSVCNSLAEAGLIERDRGDNKKHIYTIVSTGDIKDVEIDFDEILSVDPGPVMDPLTGIEYANFEDSIMKIRKKDIRMMVTRTREKDQKGLEDYDGRKED